MRGYLPMHTLPLRQRQLDKLNRLLNEVWERNPFYTHKWCAAGVPHHRLDALEQLAEFPLTTRAELLADQLAAPLFGTNRTYPASHYKRVHRSSGTTKAPMFWPDTMASWRWIIHCSQQLFSLAGVKSDDRLLFILNFGGSSGASIIYESTCQFGCGCVAADAADLAGQREFVRRFTPTVLVAGPDELLKLAQFIGQNGFSPAKIGINKIISFGKTRPFEEIREHAHDIWRAEAFDRYGMTEAGSIAGECSAHSGMHLLENEFIAEIIQPETLQPLPDGECGELVLTNLGRIARPIVRYRTGDLVRLVREHHCPCGRQDALLIGGVRRI